LDLNQFVNQAFGYSEKTRALMPSFLITTNFLGNLSLEFS